MSKLTHIYVYPSLIRMCQSSLYVISTFCNVDIFGLCFVNKLHHEWFNVATESGNPSINMRPIVTCICQSIHLATLSLDLCLEQIERTNHSVSVLVHISFMVDVLTILTRLCFHIIEWLPSFLNFFYSDLNDKKKLHSTRWYCRIALPSSNPDLYLLCLTNSPYGLNVW